MTRLQKTLMMMDRVLPGRFLNPHELGGFLDAHSADMAKGADRAYAQATQQAYEKVQAGATFADLMAADQGVPTQ